MRNKNLLEETINILNRNGKSENDVEWVGCIDFYFTWEKFKELANYINYDSGYGSQEIASDLLIVGNDFWLSRWEYDGSEGWEFHTLPAKPKSRVNVNFLTGSPWSTLAELNGID